MRQKLYLEPAVKPVVGQNQASVKDSLTDFQGGAVNAPEPGEETVAQTPQV